MRSTPEMREGPAGNGTDSKSAMAGDSNFSVAASKVEMLLTEQQVAWCRQQSARRRRALLRRIAESFLEPADRSSKPSAYWMDPESLVAYSERLRADGWQDWEIRARLADPRQVAA